MKLDNILVLITVGLSGVSIHTAESFLVWSAGAALAGLYVMFNKE